MNTTSSTIQAAIDRILGSKRSGIPSSYGASSASASASASGPLKMPSLPSLSSMPSMPSFSFGSAASSAYSASAAVGSIGPGSYFLRVIFYIFMYGFIAFLVLVVIHFTIAPVFRFSPGDKGVIGVPASSDSLVYWNSRVQPQPGDSVPKDDKLNKYQFINNFSFSVDLYVLKLTETSANKRVILYKTDLTSTPGDFTDSSGTRASISSHMQSSTSMILYLTSTNDLGLTFYCGSSGTPYSIREIKNIPLYTPFRITVVVQDKIFTVYLNGRQSFQRIVPSAITLNGTQSTSQRFYAAPSWANTPSRSVYLQNFQLWPRAIGLAEVQQSYPALAAASDFDAPPDVLTGMCNRVE